jgi:carbonic anhydrase
MLRARDYAEAHPMNGAAMHPAIPALLFAALATPAYAETNPPAWDYRSAGDDEEGWGALSKHYATCDIGMRQSPIHVLDATRTAALPLKFSYEEAEVVVQKREHALIVQFEGDGNHATLDSEAFALRQIRFHTPSEHAIHGHSYSLEMQFIHQNARKEVMVAAVFAEIGDALPGLEPLMAHLPHKGAPELRLRFDPSGLLPQKTGFYAYPGSLTWPPCTEGVAWKLLKHPVTLSKEQLRAIGRLLGRNARMPHPLNERRVTESID